MAAPILATNALTTLGTLKQFIAAPEDGAADFLLSTLINQASGWIESALDRRLGKASYTEWLLSTGRQFLLVRQWPVLTVESVTQDGGLIDPTQFLIEPDGYIGCLYKDDGWTWMGYRHGLSDYPIAPSRNIEVKYTAGYVLPKDANRQNRRTLPHDLEMLCIEMIQRIFGKLQSGGSAGLKSFSISDVRWEWDNEAPASWETVLAAYRRGWR